MVEVHKLSDGSTLVEACNRISRIDSGIGILHSKFGIPNLRSNTSHYHSLVRSIIFQQLNGNAAQSIFNRFLKLFPGEEFPSPERLSNSDISLLRTAGLSKRKSEYVKGIALAFSESEYLTENYDQWTDSQVSERLTVIRGIGQWTADMFMIFTLLRPDILPLNDLGIKKGLQIFFKLPRLPKSAEMSSLTEHWRPYRSIGCWYMWKIVDENWSWVNSND